MSDEEFCKFSIEIKKLQEFADKYTGLWATYLINIPEEQKDDYLRINAFFRKLRKRLNILINNQPGEEVYQRLKDKVRKFVEIQPGYSNQPITANIGY